MFNRGFLTEVRRHALRKGVWFSAIDNVERGILSISIMVIGKVKSVLLNVQLVRIIAKLRDAGRNGFIRHLEDFGMERARAIRDQAAGFGYKNLDELVQDISFVRYVAFLDYNQPIGWKVYSIH
jgi:hypothetical protein